jgi:GT2 family glycosyltransferase
MSIAFLFDMYQRVIETLLPPDSRRRYYCQLVRAGIRGIWNDCCRASVRKVKNWLRPRFRFFNDASKKVSVVIPNYNGQRYLAECLDSLHCLDFPSDTYEIVIVDNASSDGSSEFISSNYPDVTLIQADRNLGFAGGCNLGIRHSRGEYIVFLNNDTKVDAAWLRELAATADSDPDIAIVGSKLLFMHNPEEIQNAGSYITTRGGAGDIGFHQPDIGQYDTTRETAAVCGASMLVKRKLIEEIGGFDEDFFVYGEEIDFCYRVRLRGKKIVFNPESVVYHVHAGTLGEWSPFFTFHAFRNRLLIHLKNSPVHFLCSVLYLYGRQAAYESLVKGVHKKIHLKIMVSVAKKLPKFLLKRFMVRFIIKRENDNKVMLRFTQVKPKANSSKVKKVCVYNAFLPTMGGGENQTAQVIAYVNTLFPSASVDILCHETRGFNRSHFDERNFVQMFENNFHIPLKNTQVRFASVDANPQTFISILKRLRKLSSITKEYDIFINNTFASLLPAQARINIYYCMFPQKLDYPINPLLMFPAKRFFYRFLKSYQLFLANSNYTQRWIDRYWGVNSHVLSPPIPQLKASVNPDRDNVIINIGRFFAAGHNKKQDVMIKAFIKMFNRGWVKDWKLILIGRKHSNEASTKFVESLEKLAKSYPIEFRYDASDEELKGLLDRAKIYWHATGFGEDPDLAPEKFEHFGISTVEAIHFGLVPVVFNAGGQVELVNHGQSGFLWNTIDELMNYTRLLAEDDRLRKQLSESAFTFSRTFVQERRAEQLRCFLARYYEWRRPEHK